MHPAIRKLLTWYNQHQRTLPWRGAAQPDGTPDAYRIFISELMLQQTQVDRVLPKFVSFLKRFPGWEPLAEAKTADLVRAWAGLGYNRRVLFARDAAQQVVRDGVPKTEDGWRKLKGVGPYMAAALAEFVNHRRAIVIDTNVRRVAGRVLLGVPHPTIDQDADLRHALEAATPKTGRHWDLPQAFMDLGSAVCLPKPLCAICPLRSNCPVADDFLAGRVPKKSRRAPTERIHAEKKYPDRIYRGRILGYVREHGPTRWQLLGPHIDPTFDQTADADWIRAMAERLVKDGLLNWGAKDILQL